MIDRISDALLLGGVAWYLASTQPGRVSVLPLAVLAASLLISYERAKAESLGFDARGGLMERAERLIVLGFGLLFESLLVPVLWVMLVLTLITAGQRFERVWRQASAPQGPAAGGALAPAASPVRRSGRGVGRRSDTAVAAEQDVGPQTGSPPRWPPIPPNRPDGRRHPRISRRLRDRPGLPGSVIDVLALGVAGLAALRPGDQRAMVERHQRRVDPGLGGAELRLQRRGGVFRSYGRYYGESFRLPTIGAEELDRGLTLEGFEHVEESLARGVGPMLVLPHLGSWEWWAYWLTRVRKVPVTAVVERVEPPALFDWFVEFRERIGMEIVPLGPDAAGRSIVKAIKQAHVIALLCDRDIGGGGTEVTFFGETTTLPSGPAVLALRTGAPLIPTGVYDQGGGHHHGILRPPIPVGAPGILPRRRGPHHPGDGTRPRGPDPPRPRAMAPAPAQLAQRPSGRPPREAVTAARPFARRPSPT